MYCAFSQFRSVKTHKRAVFGSFEILHTHTPLFDPVENPSQQMRPLKLRTSANNSIFLENRIACDSSAMRTQSASLFIATEHKRKR